MKAVTWHGKRDVRVDDGPGPDDRAADRRDHPGHVDRDLRLRPAPVRGARARSWTTGDILGHEPMGIVEEVGARGDRTRAPATASSSRSTSPAGTASCATTGLQSQCETTQVREQGMGAALFGYTQALRPGAGRPGRVPARAAGAVRADQGARGAARRPVPVPLRRAADGLAGGASTPTCPTAARWSSSGSGRSARWRCRIAQHRGAGQVIGARPRAGAARARARAHGVDDDRPQRARDDVVGRRARADRRPRPGRGDRRRRHGGARRAGRQARPARSPACCPTPSPQQGRWRRPASTGWARSTSPSSSSAAAAPSRSPASTAARPTRCRCCRCSTSRSQLRMGQANVRRWIDDILPLLDATTTRSASTTSPPTTSRSTEAPAGLRDVPEEGGRRVQGRVPPVKGALSGA